MCGIRAADGRMGIVAVQLISGLASGLEAAQMRYSRRELEIRWETR